MKLTFTTVAASAATVDATAWYELVNRNRNRNRNSGKALDVCGVSTADGACIQQYTRSGGTNQQWHDIRRGTGRQGRFSYSTDGVTFTAFSPAFAMTNAWQFFMDYRYGIFNDTTQALGGTVTVERFELNTP